VVDQIKRRVQRRVSSKLRTNTSGLNLGGAGGPEYRDPVPEKFKSMVEFGFPPSAKEGEPPPPSGLGAYVGQLETLASET
jgi:hypothetical protein